MINTDEYNKNSKSLNDVTFIDLFAGIGGFRTALESYGAQCVFSSEWDKDAQDTYERNYGERPYGDITKIREEEIPAHDILCAGFPCQPFSISGKQRGFKDTRGTLFFDVARITKYHKPKIVFLENVKNFASHDGGRTLEVVKSTLNDIGYDVYYKVLNAANYGVPQKRERIYFVCFRKDLNIESFMFPKPVPLVKHLCDLLEKEDAVDSRLYINRNDIVMNSKVEDHYVNTSLRLGTVNKGGQGERIYSIKGTAITLSAYGGGIGAKTGLYLVGDKIRRLTPRECARLDGYSDSFVLPNNRNIAYKQFGNSIVVDVLQYIILQIIIQAGAKIV